MATVQFYPIDLTYKLVKGKPNIYMYGRTQEGKQICVVDESAEPYFFILAKEGVKLDELITKLKEVTVEKKGVEPEITRIDTVKRRYNSKEREVLQVFTNIPKAIPAYREHLKKHPDIEEVLEADILFTRRFLIDKNITPLVLTTAEGELVKERSKVPVFKATKVEQTSTESLDDLDILAFDIETYNPLGKVSMPEKFPVVMIAFYGLRKGKPFNKVITWKKFKTEIDYIEFVDGEAELIEAFKDTIEEYSPDILTGYYSDGFDLPYLQTRADKYKIKLDLSFDHSQIQKPRGTSTVWETVGLVNLDILTFIRRVIARTLKTDSLKLDSVAHELLGEKKQDVDIERLAEVWDAGSDELEEYCTYNLKDAQLTYEICEQVLPNITELVKLIGQPIQTTARMSFSQFVEWFLIKRSQDFDQMVPNKPKYHELMHRQSVRVKGAFVFEPTPGLYENLVVFDFRSLYPTIITAHNISPEALNCRCCRNKDRVPLDDEEFWFCKNKDGFFSTVLKDVITRRTRVKEMMKSADDRTKKLLDARQNSLKVIANSFYGYLGFSHARWYSRESQESVTAYGRHYIHQTIDEAKKKGFEVIYSDTDSIFLKLDEKTEEDALKFCEEINFELPGLMELEFEGKYSSAIFVHAKAGEAGAKKKYALLSEDGHISIKGFEFVRRNWSAVSRETQKEVLDIVLKEKDPKKAFDHVKDVVKKLREHTIPIEKVTISMQLQKEISAYESKGPHVAAATRMKNQGAEVVPGIIITYVVTRGKGKISDRVKLPDEVDENDYDPEYYIANQVVPAVDKILEVFGYSKDDLLKEKSQSKLDSFFG